MAEYIIQKAVEVSKVKKGYLDDLSTYEQQAKYDGCCAVLIFEDDYSHCESRTGEVYVSMDQIGEQMAGAEYGLFKDVAVIGEAWWPGKGEFNKISGEFRRQCASDRLLFIINDVIPLEDFKAGECRTPYIERVADYRKVFEARYRFANHWLPGSSDPQERCNALVALGGFDGLILRKQGGFWERGRGTTGEIVKIKQKLSFDLQVKEVNEVPGKKTGRPVYKLVVDFGGRDLGVGSGLPHTFDDVPKVGDIVEVEAMDYSSDGLLREPRYKGIRFDKTQPD